MSILVIDVGTTSMRGILYSENGEKLAVDQRPNHVRFEANGWVSESPADWENNTTEIVKAITGDRNVNVSAIEAVAITSQRSSIIPVDAEGRPLMDTIMWQDVRNREICRRLEPRNAELFAKTGSRVNSVFSGSKMTWVREERPDLYAKTRRFVNIPEYINFLMTGAYCSDYTYASRSGLMNLAEKKWDPELLKLYQVDGSKLLPLVEPGSVAGHVSPSFAERTGLPAGIPVIHAGGDQQCAAIGQGVTREGNVSVVLGTGGFLIAACDRIPEHLKDDVICNCASIAGKYVIEANVLACSAAFDWFVHEFYDMADIDYSVTEGELQKVSGVSDVLVIPYLKGRGAPDWNADAKAVFADVTLATTRAAMFKGLMEGIFMELANHLDNFSEYIPLKAICASGGLTKSPTLCQLFSDVIGRPVQVRRDPESTARGAFLVACTGLGKYKSVDEAAERTGAFSGITTYTPDMDRHAEYTRKQEKMNAYYRRNLHRP